VVTMGDYLKRTAKIDKIRLGKRNFSMEFY
jgi:hypothetical protein